MAHNVQNVTLALTLPISCHICLGKVRQPVICVNHHVFCSSCIDLWLKNNNQCPACRVPITPDNPCKDIIGGTSENESLLSHSVRKHLRKTRLELLQKEYEDEIESLLRETEELRRRNLILEERLNRVAEPVSESSSCSCGNIQGEDKSSVCNKLLEDWNMKLDMVNAANKKVTEDIDKFKEENRRLKTENIEFVRENVRLKNEVELRSPQKFGRFTVAALQAKVDQYEREMSRLRKALERSDQYIEELEAQIVHLKRPQEDKQVEKSQCGKTALMEEHAGRAVTSHVCQDISAANSCPEHSHDNGICAGDSSGLYLISARLKQTESKTVCSPKLKNGLHTAEWNGEEQTRWDKDSPRMGTVSVSQEMGSPSSSLPFSSLQLNTPDSKTSAFYHTNLKKPLTYLRKLVFDDLPQRRELGKLAPSGSEHHVNSGDGTKHPGQPNAIFSNFCHINRNPLGKNSEMTNSGLQFKKQETNVVDQILSRPHTTNGEDLNHPGTSHENSADIKHTLSHHESSKQTRSSSEFNSLSSSLANNEEQTLLFMAHASTDSHNIDFHNHSHSYDLPCVSLNLEEEARYDSDKVFFQGHISEPSCLSSSPPQSYNESPPAKRKQLNPCNNSPPKSSKH